MVMDISKQEFFQLYDVKYARGHWAIINCNVWNLVVSRRGLDKKTSTLCEL